MIRRLRARSRLMGQRLDLLDRSGAWRDVEAALPFALAAIGLILWCASR